VTTGRERWRPGGRLVATLLAPLVGLLLCEGLLRWLLFSRLPLARRWGQSFRDAALFVPTNESDDYQVLRHLFSAPDPRRSVCVPHPGLGWIPAELEPETLRHPDEERLGGRRPVLLFGSSYAACWFPVRTCFQELLERSELARDHCLINYGVPAYGLDQTVLLASRCVPRFAARRPVVVLTVVVDNDLPRSRLGFFLAPKPRFVEERGEFRLQLPDELDPRRYIERHPPAIASYLARYLVHGVGLLPGRGAPAADELRRAQERRALAMHCLSRAQAELEAAGIEHFVVLFHSPLSLPPLGEMHADEPALLAHLAERGMPFVDTRAILAEECRRSGSDVRELYLAGPGSVWHPNDRGTEVLFTALRLGLERRYDPAR
jgi:hypothetical protein